MQIWNAICYFHIKWCGNNNIWCGNNISLYKKQSFGFFSISMFLQFIIVCLPCQNVIYMSGNLFLWLLLFGSETKLILHYCSSILMKGDCLFASNLDSIYWLNHDSKSCSLTSYSLVFAIHLMLFMWHFILLSTLPGSDQSSFNNSVADQQVGCFSLEICWT